jgi:phosphohistidine swiveling domain-containing protein
VNEIRKRFAAEVEKLYPALHETYRRIGIYQKNRSDRNAAKLEQQLAAVAPLVQFFQPYVPGQKQAYFAALVSPHLQLSDRIVALDIAIGALHVDFPAERAYAHRESARLQQVVAAARPVGNTGAAERPGDAYLTGEPASPGVAKGPVHLASVSSSYRRAPSGAVLVAASPRPELLATLSDAAAIVAERPGQLSHAAIIARELGVPCVVGVTGATKRLKETWIVSVDGNTGAVYR